MKVYQLKQMISAFDNYFKDDWNNADEMPNNYVEVVGLCDMVESTLKRLGITEERFKSWFNLKECNCSKRKKWLNNILSWRKKK